MPDQPNHHKFEVQAFQVRRGDKLTLSGREVIVKALIVGGVSSPRVTIQGLISGVPVAIEFHGSVMLVIERPDSDPDAELIEIMAKAFYEAWPELPLDWDDLHDDQRCSFAADHQSRFPACHGATTARSAMSQIYHFLEPDEETTLFWVGSAPDFDATRVQILLEKLPWPPAPRWNHQLIGIVPLMLGHLRAQLGELPPQPWKSEQLSRLVGVDPDAFARHTAMGDVEWTMAVWDTIMGDSK